MEVDTVIVGAGPQALTVAARWLCDRPGSLRDIMVVDPSGTWLAAWRRGFARQRIDVLRSPGVHHPEPDDMAFVNANRNRPAFDASCAATPRSGSVGPLQRPTTAAFWRFCQDLLARTGLRDQVVARSVVELHRSAGAWDVILDDGGVVRARRVVWAGNPRVPRIPDGVELGTAVVGLEGIDLDQVRPGQRIAVVGAGPTAGQLARRAPPRGAVVTVGA
ncbi:MAG: FAD/NAD(P)-binding protein, partial [Actinomycetota bacterium]